ncbi:carbon-nitrogen hydrolase [Streptacidiphilus sp. NEAU-YB345]|uniref:Carbon-nitrogen hydrolase n=1 Tax=Streptacidiphilus fuscans TaxID=2789292 RepID=A0A931B0D4_9ACTN|nr:carbon-nitrogen hydrolase [Streptacidiphilus fuscans]
MTDDGSSATTRVACCQLAPVLGESAANRAATLAAIESAVEAGARIVMLPELPVSGYVFADPVEALALAEPVDGPTVTAWAEAAARHDIVVVGGLCEAAPDGTLRNSSVLLDRSGLRAVYRKAHLWDAEKLFFTPGDAAPPVVDTPHGRIGMMICYDLEFPEWVRKSALAGAELLCAPVNWPVEPVPEAERPAWGAHIRVQAGAMANRLPIAVADRAGRERGVDWIGGSVVVNADGWPLVMAEAGTDATQILIADIDLADSRDKQISERNDVHADRRPWLY